DQLRAHGSVERGWLGVQIQKVTPEIASAVGLKLPQGALVADVQANSPAAKARLKRGDVILTFNGHDVGEMRDLPKLVAATKAGRGVELAVWHNRARETLEVDTGRLKEEKEAAAEDQPDTAKPVDLALGQTSKALGAKLATLTSKNRQQYGIGSDVEGVVVV